MILKDSKNLFTSTKTKFFELVKQYGIILLVLIIAPYYVLIPLFEYETWPSGHDSMGTVFNALEVVKTLREDFHLPIIWQADNAGLKGNPHWAFYQPLSFIVIYFTSALASLFDNHYYVFSGMKVAVFLSFIISEVGMFFLLRKIFHASESKNLISLFGAIIYLFSPYRFIDLYSRNAYSELWIFTWMPFYFLGFYKLFFLKEKNGWILIALFTPVLFISHLMPSFFFIMLIHLGFFVYLLIKRSLKTFLKENKSTLIYWFIANVIGITASLIYVIPANNALKHLNGDIRGFDRVDLNTVLEHISWCYAFLDLSNSGERWQAGQLFLISIAILLFLFIAKRKIQLNNLAVFLICALSMTIILLLSKTAWQHLPPILYGLQFSWRLFLVYSFLCSIIMALLVNEFKVKIPFLILIIILHFYSGAKFLHSAGEDMVHNNYNAESWLNQLYREKYTVPNSHSPQSVLLKTTEPILFNFNYANEVGTNEKYSNNFILNLKPGTEILSHHRKGNTFLYDLALENPTFLIVKQYLYPSWELYIDGKKSKDLYLTDKGFIGFEVPRGNHHIKLRTN